MTAAEVSGNGKSVTVALVAVIGSAVLMFGGIGGRMIWDHDQRIQKLENKTAEQLEMQTDDRFRRREWLLEKARIDEQLRQMREKVGS